MRGLTAHMEMYEKEYIRQVDDFLDRMEKES